MAESKKSEIGNIFWRHIPRDAKVTYTGASWVAEINGKKYLANWQSIDAINAQDFLNSLVNKTDRLKGVKSSIKQKLKDIADIELQSQFSPLPE